MAQVMDLNIFDYLQKSGGGGNFIKNLMLKNN